VYTIIQGGLDMEKNISYSSEQENAFEEYILDFLYQSGYMEH